MVTPYSGSREHPDDDEVTRPGVDELDQSSFLASGTSYRAEDAGLTRLSASAVASAEQREPAHNSNRIASNAETGDGCGSAVPADSGSGPLVPGQQFGTRYRIISLIGVGGMGAVYKAWDGELGVVVALKVIRPEVMSDPEAARAVERRFKHELLLARQVTHRNVVRIHDLGDVGGIKYMTMPFIEGEDLAAILKREGSLPVSRVMPIARTIVSGLVAAHEAGIVHRDLKPANIMVNAQGEALIMDFGVARSAAPRSTVPIVARAAVAAAGPAFEGQTLVGSVVGTVEYMAPEQARAEAVDQRADIYAVGLILYDLLLGRKRSERTESAIAELTSRMQAPPRPIREIDPAIPESLAQIIGRCVQPDPAARFDATKDLEAALDRLDDEGNLLPVIRRLTTRMMVAVGAVVVLLLAATYWLARGPAPQIARPPMSVLVADFDNRTGEQVFAGVAEQTVEAAMEGASFINAFSRPQARQIAAQNIKAGNILNESVARLVALRETIDMVLGGTIERKGSTYAVTLRAVRPAADRDELLTTASARAANRNEVLKAIATAAASLRKRLGDTASESVRLSAAETFTSSSPEAIKSFTTAQDLLFSGRNAEAYDAFLRATQQDAGFARAYSSAAIAARALGRQREEQELWKKALSLSDRLSERERYRMLGAYYLTVAQNYDKAIDNFSTLLKLYPSDRVGSASLALAYFWSVNIPKALEEGKRSVALDRNSAIVRSNYALYAMYAGEFELATTEIMKVLQERPSPDVAEIAYVPLAFAALAKRDWTGAEAAYNQMAAVSPAGASRAALGLGDMAVYQGRYADAERLLAAGIAADEKSSTALLAAKYVCLAEAYEAQDKRAAALAAARKAVKASAGQPVQILAAGVLMRLGAAREANDIRAFYSQQLTLRARAYARVLVGQAAFLDRRTADALDAFTEARKFRDIWLARFNAGVAFAQAGHYAEAIEELDRCQKRRGEAAAIFLDEVPTFRYLATLPYWLAKAHEGLGAVDAAKASYATYLATRGESKHDPLVIDARARLAALGN